MFSIAPLVLKGVVFLGAGLALGAHPEWLRAHYRRHSPSLFEEYAADDDTGALRRELLRELLLVAPTGTMMILLGLLG